MTSFQVKVLQKKFTLLHADFSKIVLKYSNEVHLLRYLTPLCITNYIYIYKNLWLMLVNMPKILIFNEENIIFLSETFGWDRLLPW
jgi:hypothetical protein